MTEALQLAALALLQGLTEFLPVSSSAHLILPSQLLGWPDQGLAFDVAVHLGSLMAVLAYFRRDLFDLGGGVLRSISQRRWSPQVSMLCYLGVATLPVAVAGLLLKDLVTGEFRSTLVIAMATIGFGLLLAWADRARGTATEITLSRALWIGCAQALAIIPGTSRSGITMTAGLFSGLDRETAARFSFLLSIPVILAAATLLGSDLWSSPEPVAWKELLLAMVMSGITAYVCIEWFLKLVERIGLLPFVVYRCVLGLVLLSIYF